MSQQLHERMNQIPDKILSETFLQSQGLGNEIGFWIFDYPPEHHLLRKRFIATSERFDDRQDSLFIELPDQIRSP
jgi:hypothetical protein